MTLPPKNVLLSRMSLTLALREAKVDHQVLAYNVIRLLMAQAAAMAGVDPRGLSFKHTVQGWP